MSRYIYNPYNRRKYSLLNYQYIFEFGNLETHFKKHLVLDRSKDMLWQRDLDLRFPLQYIREEGKEKEYNFARESYKKLAEKNIKKSKICLPLMHDSHLIGSLGFIKDYKNDELISIASFSKRQAWIRSCFYKKLVVEHYHIYLYYYFFKYRGIKSLDLNMMNMQKRFDLKSNDLDYIGDNDLALLAFEANYLNNKLDVDSRFFEMMNYCLLWKKEFHKRDILIDFSILHFLVLANNKGIVSKEVDNQKNYLKKRYDKLYVKAQIDSLNSDVRKILKYFENNLTKDFFENTDFLERYNVGFFYYTVLNKVLKLKLILKYYELLYREKIVKEDLVFSIEQNYSDFILKIEEFFIDYEIATIIIHHYFGFDDDLCIEAKSNNFNHIKTNLANDSEFYLLSYNDGRYKYIEYLEELIKTKSEKFNRDINRMNAKIYNESGVGSTVFHKIIDRRINYNPSKYVVIRLLMPLELEYEEFNHAMRFFGYTFDYGVKDDIIKKHIRNKEYNLYKIDEELFINGCPLLMN